MTKSELLAAADALAWAARDDVSKGAMMERAREFHAQAAADTNPKRLWLWKNFVNGRPEYWAFDNPYPIHLDYDDPMTIGEPCGYALVFESRNGRPDISEDDVLKTVERVNAAPPPKKAAAADAPAPVACLHVTRKYLEWDGSAKTDKEGYIFVNATANKAAALLPIGHYDLYTVPPALAAEVARLRGLLGEAQIHVLARDLHDRIEAAIKENNT